MTTPRLRELATITASSTTTALVVSPIRYLYNARSQRVPETALGDGLYAFQTGDMYLPDTATLAELAASTQLLLDDEASGGELVEIPAMDTWPENPTVSVVHVASGTTVGWGLVSAVSETGRTTGHPYTRLTLTPETIPADWQAISANYDAVAIRFGWDWVRTASEQSESTSHDATIWVQRIEAGGQDALNVVLDDEAEDDNVALQTARFIARYDPALAIGQTLTDSLGRTWDVTGSFVSQDGRYQNYECQRVFELT